MNLDVLHGLRHVLFKRDVLWLLQRCPEGRTVSNLCSPFFMDLVDDDDLVTVKRAHHEPLPWGGGDRLVLTCVFRQAHGGVSLVNEVVCVADDFRRVVKLAPLAEDDEVSDEDYPNAKRQYDDLVAQQEVEGSPWEEDELMWDELLGGE